MQQKPEKKLSQPTWFVKTQSKENVKENVKSSSTGPTVSVDAVKKDGQSSLGGAIGASVFSNWRDSEKDDKSQSGDIPLVVMPKSQMDNMIRVARGISKAGKGGMTKPVPMRVTSRYALTSAANTAYTATTAITPLGMTDSSGISSVFDEFRATSVEMWWKIETSAAPIINRLAMIGWSPSSSDSITSIEDGVALQQFSGPAGVGLTLNPSPAPYAPYGLFYKRFKIHGPTPVSNTGNSNVVAGGWFAAQDINATVGYLLPYSDAMGGSTTATFTVVVRVNLECRART